MYERFYGLSAPPFQLTPDPRLLFEAQDHRRALSYLRYGLQRREGFVIVTGHVGTGKTLLLQTMLSDLRDQHLTIARVALANLDGPSVMPSVAAAFGIESDYSSKFDLMEALVRHLAPNRVRGALLIVDEAQACSREALEELRTLSNLQANGQALIQIFLIGQSELRETLTSSTMAHLRQRVVASHHLKPLDKDEVPAYVDYRLAQVGRDGPPYFGDGVLEHVYTWSSGIPRQINVLMDRLLLYGYLEDKHELQRDDIETVIAEFAEEFPDELADVARPASVDQQPTDNAAADDARSQVVAELDERIAFIEQVVKAKYGAAETNALLARYQARSEQRAIADAKRRLDQLEQAVTELAHDEDNAAGPDQPPVLPDPGPEKSDQQPTPPDPEPNNAPAVVAGDDSPGEPTNADSGPPENDPANDSEPDDETPRQHRAEPADEALVSPAHEPVNSEQPTNGHMMNGLTLEDWVPSKLRQDELGLHAPGEQDARDETADNENERETSARNAPRQPEKRDDAAVNGESLGERIEPSPSEHGLTPMSSTRQPRTGLLRRLRCKRR